MTPIPPAAEAIITPTAPPTAMRAEWWPCHVRVPDLPTFHNVKVYAADTGLFGYVQRPDPAGGGARVELLLAVGLDYDKTPQPPTGYAARMAGVALLTDIGRVIVQPTGGCGCGYRAIKTWRPDWASRNQAWRG